MLHPGRRVSGPVALSLKTFLPPSPPPTQTCLTRPSLAALMLLASRPCGNSSSSGGASFSSMTGTARDPSAPQSCSKVRVLWARCLRPGWTPFHFLKCLEGFPCRCPCPPYHAFPCCEPGQDLEPAQGQMTLSASVLAFWWQGCRQCGVASGSGEMGPWRAVWPFLVPAHLMERAVLQRSLLLSCGQRPFLFSSDPEPSESCRWVRAWGHSATAGSSLTL